jgi:hypothetical protein
VLPCLSSPLTSLRFLVLFHGPAHSRRGVRGHRVEVLGRRDRGTREPAGLQRIPVDSDPWEVLRRPGRLTKKATFESYDMSTNTTPRA